MSTGGELLQLDRRADARGAEAHAHRGRQGLRGRDQPAGPIQFKFNSVLIRF